MKKIIQVGLILLMFCAFGILTGCVDIEQPDWLFEESCTHDFGEYEIIKDATCTTKGLKVQFCNECGETKLKRTKALGHEVYVDTAIAPTCTETGLTEGSHCKRCDEVFTAQEVIPATGHTLVTLEAVPATCVIDGLTEGEHCSVCELVTIPQESVLKDATNHATLVYETNDNLNANLHAVKCDACGFKKTEGHYWYESELRGTVGVDLRSVVYCQCGTEVHTFDLANVDENGNEIIKEVNLHIADDTQTTNTTFRLLECIAEKVAEQEMDGVKSLYLNGEEVMTVEELENAEFIISATIFNNTVGLYTFELILYFGDFDFVLPVKVNVVNNYEHVDENSDFACDLCDILIYPFDDPTAYTEADVVDGEVVAGNWYRLYRPQSEYDDIYVNFGLSATWSDDWMFADHVTLMAGSTSRTWGLGYLMSAGAMGDVFKEMKSVITSEYIDVYLAVGVYTFEGGSATTEITEETTITVGNNGAYIKRLEVVS